MSAGLSGMAEGSAEFFYRAHFRAQTKVKATTQFSACLSPQIF